jgi:predicted nuclease of predicted toxin-antitoxin system
VAESRDSVRDGSAEPIEFWVWVDAQLPPSLARHLQSVHRTDAVHVEEIGLLRARDTAIFAAARKAERSVVLLSKDDDFPKLLGQHGPPPRVIWVRCGNVRNRELRRIVSEAWADAIALLEAGEPLVEIRRRS